jgi:hypothetical protein
MRDCDRRLRLPERGLLPSTRSAGAGLLPGASAGMCTGRAAVHASRNRSGRRAGNVILHSAAEL